MWAKIKAWCWHSLTVAWAYIQIIAAAAVLGVDAGLDKFAAAISDPAIIEQAHKVLPPQWVGYLVGFIGIVTLAARLRSLLRG